MDIDVRFCCSTSPLLVDTLEKYAVKYREADRFIIFHIKESDPNFQAIEQATKEFRVTDIRTRVYTKREIDNARWFYMRSKCGKVVQIEGISFEHSCRQSFYYQGIEMEKFRHVRQIAPIHARKVPKWKPKNNFYSTDNGDFWKLFCSDHARDALEQNTAGLKFMLVLKGKTSEPLEDIHQLILPQNLPVDALEFDGQVAVNHCPYCGAPSYDPVDPGTFIPRVRKEYLSDQCDYYATESVFGPGIGHPIYIVSRKVYETVTQGLNERNLVFMPIETI